MYLFAVAREKPHFWTVEVVLHPLPCPSLQNHTCPETICTSSVLVYHGGVLGNPGLL